MHGFAWKPSYEFFQVHETPRHQVFGNALFSCRQSLLEDSGPRCPIDCDKGAKKTIESRFENTFKASQHVAEAIWDFQQRVLVAGRCWSEQIQSLPVSSRLLRQLQGLLEKEVRRDTNSICYRLAAVLLKCLVAKEVEQSGQKMGRVKSRLCHYRFPVMICDVMPGLIWLRCFDAW